MCCSRVAGEFPESAEVTPVGCLRCAVIDIDLCGLLGERCVCEYHICASGMHVVCVCACVCVCVCAPPHTFVCMRARSLPLEGRRERERERESVREERVNE